MDKLFAQFSATQKEYYELKKSMNSKTSRLNEKIESNIDDV